MNNQNLVLLAVGAFVALIVTVTAIDQYLQNAHPPTEVSGLVWRIENAFSHIDDLEAVLEITKVHEPNEPIRLVVRYLSVPLAVLSVRYVLPNSMEGELFVVENDQLSHYLPQENLVVIKRWVGVPLAAVGLAQFSLSGLRDEWLAGKVRIEIVKDVPGFTRDLFQGPLALDASFSQPENATVDFSPSFQSTGGTIAFSFSSATGTRQAPYATSWEQVATLGATGSIAGDYILEARDARSNELERMIWVDRETFLIRKIVVFEDGQRSSTLRVERIDRNQGLTEDDVINLPSRGVETIRG